MLQKIGIARLIISAFLAVLLMAAYYLNLPMGLIGGDMLTRFGMNVLLVMALIPTIRSGTGPNFGLPIGILCGLVAMTLSIEFDLSGFTALIFSIVVAIILGVGAGSLYGLLLNRVIGQEMTVGTFVSWSIVSLMSIFWLMAPYSSPEMIWPVGGQGLRVTIVMTGRMNRLLDEFWAFQIFGMTVPTGLLLFAALCCVLLWFFLRSRTGVAMTICGANPRFAVASGLNVNHYRLVGAVVSTAMGAVGIIIFSQSFGFIQLYQAPFFMAFAAVSAILIGGASLSRATISQALIGAFLFNSLLVVAPPVANRIIESEIAEILRLIISNGIILYALTRKSQGGELG